MRKTIRIGLVILLLAAVLGLAGCSLVESIIGTTYTKWTCSTGPGYMLKITTGGYATLQKTGYSSSYYSLDNYLTDNRSVSYSSSYGTMTTYTSGGYLRFYYSDGTSIYSAASLRAASTLRVVTSSGYTYTFYK